MTPLSLASLLLLAASAYSQPFEGVLEPKICVPKGVECLALSNVDVIESGSFIVYNVKGLNKEYMDFHANVAEPANKCSVIAEYIDADENDMTDLLFVMSSERFAEAVLVHNQTAKVPVDSFFPLLAINVRDDIVPKHPSPNMFLPGHQGVLSWGTNWQSLKNRTVDFNFFCFSFGIPIEVNIPKPGTKTQAPGSVAKPAPLPDLAHFTSHGHRPEVMATISSALAGIVVAVLSYGSL
ncbi:hypothetical protein DFS34DRAFT_188285 [Phlyctochytrium arcticum]|nr:hypothetical protein DFS34DRAFT_188285 [Phlyctochytrium arcticum]